MFDFDDDSRSTPVDLATTALASFESHPQFADIMLQVIEGVNRVNQEHNVSEIHPRTPERLEYVLTILDSQASPPLDFISDVESLKNYCNLVQGLGYRAWNDYVCIIGVQPLADNPEMNRIQLCIRHWVTEAYRRLSAVNKLASERTVMAGIKERRGYKSEVRAWMHQQGFTSVAQAARRLGVSDSTLKSIMSKRGDVRYSTDTLAQVLEKIGCRNGGE